MKKSIILFLVCMFIVACSDSAGVKETPKNRTEPTLTPRNSAPKPKDTKVPSPAQTPTHVKRDLPAATIKPTEILPSVPESVKPFVEILVAGANVRKGPGTDNPTVGVLKLGEKAELIDISADGNWFNVLLPNGGSGWVGSSVAKAAEIEDLNAVQDREPELGETATLSNQSEVNQETGALVSVQESSVNLRSGPGVEYEVIGVGLQGDEFEAVGVTGNGNWLNVKLQGKRRAWLAVSVVSEVARGGLSRVVVASTIPAPPIAIDTSIAPTVQTTATLVPAEAPVIRMPAQPSSGGCCKICSKGKACGDSCIPKSWNCRKPSGCACNG